VLTSVNMALIAIEFVHTTSNRGRWILAAVLCLGVIALLMLARFWRHIGKESYASTRASASNTRWSGP
jgi:protein-S-isoprenylcysteine O-methyltransferase Ste14